MKLKIVLEPSNDGGFTVFVPTLPGCISEGESKEEAVKNIREAIELYLEPVEDDLALSPEAEQIELAVLAKSRASRTSRCFGLYSEMAGLSFARKAVTSDFRNASLQKF